MDVPHRINVGRLIRSGVFPFWTPNLINGFPIFSENQSSVLYPPTLIYALFPSPAGHALWLALHVIIGQFAVYCLLREYVNRPLAVAVGIVIWSYFLQYLGEAIPVEMPPFALLPSCLYLAGKASQSISYCLWLSVLQGIMLIASAQGSLLCWVMTCIYLVVVTKQSSAQMFRTALFAFVVPLLLALPSLYGIIDYLSQAKRYTESNISRKHDLLLSFPLIFSSLALPFALAYLRNSYYNGRFPIVRVFVYGLFGVVMCTDTPLFWVLVHLPPLVLSDFPDINLFIVFLANVLLLSIAAERALAAADAGTPVRKIIVIGALLIVAFGIVTVDGITTYLSSDLGFYNRTADSLLAARDSRSEMRIFNYDELNELTPVLEQNRTLLNNRQTFRMFVEGAPANYSLVPGIATNRLAQEYVTILPRGIQEINAECKKLIRPGPLWAAGISHLVGHRPVALSIAGLSWTARNAWPAGRWKVVPEELTPNRIMLTLPEHDGTQHEFLLDALGIKLFDREQINFSMNIEGDKGTTLSCCLSQGFGDQRKNIAENTITLGASGRGHLDIRGTPDGAGQIGRLSLSVKSAGKLIKLSDIKYTTETDRIEQPINELAGFLKEVSRSPVWLYELKDSQPTAWMVFDTKCIADRKERLTFLNDYECRPHTQAILSNPTDLLFRSTNDWQIKSSRPRLDELVLDINSSERGLCITTVRHDHNLYATIDGKPLPIETVNHAFCGFVVPAGTHEIRLVYRLKYFSLTAFIAALSWMALFVAYARVKRAVAHSSGK